MLANYFPRNIVVGIAMVLAASARVRADGAGA